MSKHPPRRLRAGWRAAALSLCVAAVALTVDAPNSFAHSVAATPSPLTGGAALGWSSCPTPPTAAQNTAPGGGPSVALTFDDGPGPSTPAILAILESFHVRATFFNIGLNELRWPAVVAAEANGGFLVGDHSWSHPFLTSLSPSQQLAQLAAVGAQQRQITGSTPCVFRPPYGDYDQVTSTAARSLHMSLWTWSVDTQDWKAGGSASPYWTQRIVSLAESEGGAQAHPVVLLHNQSIAMPATVTALPTIIEYFLARHYRFVDLLGRSGPPDACSNLARFAPAASRRLRGVLRAGHAISSPNGQYVLRQEPTGALTLASGAERLWSTPTAGHPGATTRVSASGRLEVLSTRGAVLWASGGRRGDWLSVADDGSVTLSTSSHVWWQLSRPVSALLSGQGLRSGWSLYSADRACRITMSRDGRLRVTSALSGLLWESNSLVAPGAVAVMEANGNLDIMAHHHLVLWSSGSVGARSRLALTPAGGAAVISPTGRRLWSTP